MACNTDAYIFLGTHLLISTMCLWQGPQQVFLNPSYSVAVDMFSEEINMAFVVGFKNFFSYQTIDYNTH